MFLKRSASVIDQRRKKINKWCCEYWTRRITQVVFPQGIGLASWQLQYKPSKIGPSPLLYSYLRKRISYTIVGWLWWKEKQNKQIKRASEVQAFKTFQLSSSRTCHTAKVVEPQISKIFSSGYGFPHGNLYAVSLLDQLGQEKMI